MSATATLPSSNRPASPSAGFLRRLYDDEPLMTASAVALTLLIVPLAAAGMLDGRTHLGVGIWVKPIKFAIALSIFTATLAVFARWLSPQFRSSRAYRWFMIAVTGAIAAEMVWIAGAAALGTASHFNQSTPALAVLYPLMGAIATLLTSATAVYAIGIARNAQSGLTSAARESVVIGLALTLPLTLITAWTMASMTGHAVGGGGLDTGGLVLFGWLRDAGDLRVPHFFATHAMHAIPAVGLFSLTVFERNRKLLVRLSALLYVLFVAYTFVQALSGEPFLPQIG